MKLNSRKNSSANAYYYWYWCAMSRVVGVAFNEERELE
jgi:hypothetical protein